MRTLKTRGRPLKCREPIRDIEPSSDPVFTRLIRDLQLAKRAQKQIARGEISESKRDAATDLERGAFQHMFNYLNARAWVRTNDSDA
jgi:hypothetical protein